MGVQGRGEGTGARWAYRGEVVLLCSPVCSVTSSPVLWVLRAEGQCYLEEVQVEEEGAVG